MTTQEAVAIAILEWNRDVLNSLQNYIDRELLLGIGLVQEKDLWFHYLNWSKRNNYGYISHEQFKDLIRRIGGTLYWDKKYRKHFVKNVSIRRTSDLDECQCSVCTSQDVRV